jgi:creatinine amidohydrolase
MQIAELSWPDFEEAAGTTNIGLIPVGAVEVYGPHLPQGSDGIVADAICRAIADELGCLVAPLVPVGWSQPVASFPGTLNVTPEAIKSYCRGIAESLLEWNLTRLVFINGHVGNVPAIDQLCFELRERADVQLAQIDVWRFMQPFTTDLLDSEWKYAHAGEATTAVMLHLRPDGVKLDRAAQVEPPRQVDSLGLSRPHHYRDIAPSGYVGDASVATPEKGRQLFDLTVSKLIEFIRSDDFGGVAARDRPT